MYTDKQFTRTVKELMRIIFKKLSSSQPFDEVKEEFVMLGKLATHPNSPTPLTTLWGLAYMIEDKEWYDVAKGMTLIKDAAERTEDREPFCWYVLGCLYMNGQKGLDKDIVSAKYWIDKSAKVDYTPAKNMIYLRWGDNPEGFLDWFEDEMESGRPKRRIFGVLIGIALIIIVIILLTLR